VSIKETGITGFLIAIIAAIRDDWVGLRIGHQGTIASVHKGEHINALAHSGDIQKAVFVVIAYVRV
jgi:hypothetical protein